MTVRQANVTAACVLTLTGLFFIVASVPIYAKKIGMGPGAGVFPLWIGVVLTICSVAYVVIAWKSVASDPFMKASPGEKGWLMWTAASLFGYVALMQFLGFALTTFLFVVFQIRVIGHYGWRFSLIFSVISAVLCTFLFTAGLKMFLPIGVFGF